VVASWAGGEALEFRILGPLEVVERDRALTLGGSRQRTLLAVLLTRANQVVSADRLIDELWGDQPPGNAANALHYHVSRLRKALGPDAPIVTRDPGYLIRVGPDELDLLRFERLVEEGQDAAPDRAAQLLREALGLWRGPALADLTETSAARSEIRRLEELRLSALEQRCEADLALGRNADLVGELEALVSEHPLRERLRAQLMRALYGSGRQAEALQVYRDARSMFVDELGIEPSPALQDLEQAILRQDPALTRSDAATGSLGPLRHRAIMIAATDENHLDDLLTIAEPLARRPTRELIVTRLLKDGEDLAAANALLAERRRSLDQLGVSSRVAAYTTPAPGDEVALVATEHDVDLILVDAPPKLLDSGSLDEDLTAILARAPCDVGVLVRGGTAGKGPIVTPFGGVEHDWSAIEVAAWLAAALGTTLRLLGTEADPVLGRRDASRLLGRASLLVQQVVGIVAEPLLVRPGEEGVLDAARDARLLVIGLSDRWRTEGIGPVRLAVAAGARVPTLFVRRGLRPSGVAPNETLTRFTWTLTAGQIEPQ
jgi:DNA-binding SARP family transcriptional activator